eukprot:Tamp_24593.p2 GENE.Tamp_24593~~Tamp_24593.p2  ORF type:complete len:187 (-),score=38.67 Tamp_24593:15-575(-)
MSAVKGFLDRHKDEASLRIVFVEAPGPALDALRERCTVSDKRLLVAQSSNPASIAQLGEKNLPCAFVAMESVAGFFKGTIPSRRRAKHIYEKSGKDGSAMSLSKATSARYTNKGKTGDTYAVELKPTSPLREMSKCQHVFHVIVPSRNPKHSTEDNYVKDDAAGEAMLKKCYSNLLENFYHLARTR